MSTESHDPALRQRAEAALVENPPLTDPPAAHLPVQLLETLHELRVHHIELEMQNEALRRSQAALEESQRRYFDLYDRAPVGYCTVSEAGLILHANLTLTTLLGLSLGVLKMQQIARHVAYEDRDSYYLFSRQMFTGGEAASCELRLQKSDGTTFWAKLQASVTVEALGPPVLRLVVTDISLRRAATHALAQARDDAQAALRVKSAFLANMSHEIRTPMSAIIGFSRLLQSGATPEQAQQLAKIHAAGQHLMAILNDVLDLSKLDAGRMGFEDIEFDLPGLVAEVGDWVRQQAQDKGLTLQIAAEDVPRRVRGDPTRLRQALLNYLSNAVKFTRRGGVLFESSVVSRDADGTTVRFSVTDTGEGIEADKLALLFEPFVQADSSVTRRFGGTGLGLAITRRLTESMGGQVGANSQPGAGSTFWLTARLHEVEGTAIEEPTPAGAPPEAQLAQRWAGLSVLLVDDDEVCCEITSAMLQQAGFEVDLARDGADALRMVANGRYVLVLMDMRMPGMDGLTATRAIRGLPSGAALCVVALTANALELDDEVCAQVGIDAVLDKPVESSALYATILAQLTGRKIPNQPRPATG